MMLVSELVSELARGHERREALRGVPLRCWDGRALVSDLLDGDLAELQAARVARHLEGCPTCPRLCASLVAATSALHPREGRDPDTVIPPRVAARFHDPSR